MSTHAMLTENPLEELTYSYKEMFMITSCKTESGVRRWCKQRNIKSITSRKFRFPKSKVHKYLNGDL